MKYLEMKNAHIEELNNFPILWAFSNAQLKEGLSEWGITADSLETGIKGIAEPIFAA